MVTRHRITTQRAIPPSSIWWLTVLVLVSLFCDLPMAGAVTNDAMMVYDTQTITSTPKYQRWNGSWGGEASANTTTGEIRYMELKFSPVADQAILVTQGSSGVLEAQVWTGGGTNSWGAITIIGTVGAGTLEGAGINDGEQFRCWDIEYEQVSGDAVIVYQDGTADPDYKVYSSGAWSVSGSDINILTTGAPAWIELASSPGEDYLAMISIDVTIDVYGMRWNGSAWDDMNSGGAEAIWDTGGSIYYRKSIDVAFETNSADILFMWYDATQDVQNYRRYTQGTTTLETLQTLSMTNQAGLGQWVQLAADPTAGSDKIMYVEQDAQLDIWSAYWDGSAWTAETVAHDATVEIVTNMNFDVAWETYTGHTGHCWIVYGDGAGTSSRHWNGSSWDSVSTTPTSDDDTGHVRVAVQPNDGTLFAMSYETTGSASDNIEVSSNASGSSTWGAQSEIWAGPTVTDTATVALGGTFRMAIAAEIYSSSTDAMMVYDTQTITSTPKYQRWNGSWGGEASANTTTGEIRYMELKFSPVADQAILVTQGSSGVLEAQVWTGGGTNSWGAITIIGTVGAGTLEGAGINNGEQFRCWDIEYEQVSGDAVIVYQDGTADPDYKVYSSGAWSVSGSDINILTTGAPAWIELASSPGEDYLAMIVLDQNTDVYGMRWNGSGWDDMNSGGDEAVWDTAAALYYRKCIDVAFETNSNDILFMWYDGVQDVQNYRRYTHGTTTLETLQTLSMTNQAGLGQWVQLAADPTAGSDKIMYVEQDAQLDIWSAYWDGSAWTAETVAHDATVEIVTNMNFDVAWETYTGHTGHCWIVYGDGAGTSSRHWNGSSWDSVSTTPTSDDDTGHVRVAVQPNDGTLFAMSYETTGSASDNIEVSSNASGSSTWGAQSEIWAGPTVTDTATVTLGGTFRMAIAAEIAESATLGITAPTDVTLTTGNPGTTVDTTFGTGEKVTLTDGGAGWTLSARMLATLTSGSYTIPNTNVYLRKDGNVGSSDTYTIWSGTYTNVSETNATESLDASRTVGIRSSGTGGDSTEVRPSIQLVIPPSQTPASDYAGSIRFTVI